MSATAAVAEELPQAPCLTNAHQIHQLTPEQADRPHPVCLRAVTTFYSRALGELFVQDETEGIYIEIYRNNKTFPIGFPIRAGQLVEVEGESAPGGFAPDIVPRQIKLLGEAPLPQPRAVTYEQMATGQEDCNWVEFNGIVRAIGTNKWTRLPALEVVGGGGRVVVPIVEYSRDQAERLIDAEVSVRGVCATEFNPKGGLMNPIVQVSSMADVTVRKPAPANPYAIRARPITEVLHYSPREEHGHRVKVEGVVTFQQPGQALFIADDTGGLFVQTQQSDRVRPGDRVEVLGFPGAGEYVSPVVKDGIFRRTGTGAPLQPVTVAAGERRKDFYDSTLVRMEAELLNRVPRQSDQILELQSSNSIFYAQVVTEVVNADPLARIPNHSRVRVTGVCRVRADQYRLPEAPQAFTLLVHSPADVELIERPSWWTAQHSLWVLGATLAVALFFVAWVGVLRKQVKAQTNIISQKVQREAALEERSRIARDLHDDLGAGLTRIAFLSKVAQKEEPRRAGIDEHLQEISGAAQEAFQALDEIVWVVSPKNDSIDSLASYISHFAEAFFRGTDTRCRLDLPPHLPDRPIPTEMRNNLFLAAKEALNNVRKHARATEVTIRASLDASVFSLSIADNGRGFTPETIPQAGNGLLNMKQRLEKIGGRFVLQTRPEAGTAIRLIVPIHQGQSVDFCAGAQAPVPGPTHLGSPSRA